ncbi:MAG: HD domain-containing protein [Candidatus Limnocylindria bacterium]
MDLVAWAAEESQARLAPLGSRWLHCRGVATRAREIETVVAPDHRAVLVAAAYLHDVGYAPELVRCDFHPLDGAYWLQAQGLDRLAGLVAHHTGASFEAQAHGLAGDLAAFDDEQSPVTDALAYSDLTTGPVGERVTVAERLSEIERRYGPTSLVVRALERASDTLLGMMARTEARLAAHPGPRCRIAV